MDQTSTPLISVGVPTYNRPDGLRRTLSCLSAQTYLRLEILVSDNCSPGTETAKVLAEMAECDPRIRYIRQSTPLGVAGNFRFVLRETRGDYFMWAADDDEWEPTFIERCFNALQNGAASAMSSFETSYRSSGIRRTAVLPELDPMHTVATNMRAFLRCLTPSLFYGLHRRWAIGFFLEEDMFDYYDCYFILRLLANGGITLVPEKLYVAGVDAPKYVIKPMGYSWGSGLRYLPFYRASRRVFANANLNYFDRIKLETLLVLVVIRLFLVNEGRAVFTRISPA
jgi:glycosyltransferase involved in cell wall biosynthesis